uniref:SpoIID/LytB domain-containing protein n=1 Tax=Oceanivirga salmonicida TaxID=1769291 RepID=UPI00352C7CF5
MNEVNLEEYLYSVVSAEMPTYFGTEALKAQAVAARTYALNKIITNKNKSNLYDVDDTVKFQVYSGASNEEKKVTAAVNSTRSQIATYNGKPILALFHASSGDRTMSAKAVFNVEKPYLKSVEDFSSSQKWTYRISKYSLEKKFGRSYNVITNLGKNKIRRGLGASKIKSNNFSMHLSNDGIVYFYGKGSGHCVGLSQWGAKYLGQVRKYNYEEILKHYYRGISITKIGEK